MAMILLMISLAVHAQEQQEESADSWKDVPLEDIEKMDAVDLADNWGKLSETQINDLYLKRIDEFQAQFSEQHNMELSGCEDNCRFEGSMIYNEPLKQGIPVSNLAGFSAEALPEPGGGFRITGSGNVELRGNSINIPEGGSVEITEQSVVYRDETGALVTKDRVQMDIHVPANQNVVVNGILYIGEQPDGGEIIIREEYTQASGAFYFSGPKASTNGVVKLLTVRIPKNYGEGALDLNDLKITAGPFVIDPKDVEFNSGSLRIVSKYPSFDSGDINYEVNAYYPVGSNTANIRVESEAGNMNMFLRYTTGSGVVITTGYEDEFKRTYLELEKKF